jgi:hypothetical protein
MYWQASRPTGGRGQRRDVKTRHGDTKVAFVLSARNREFLFEARGCGVDGTVIIAPALGPLRNRQITGVAVGDDLRSVIDVVHTPDSVFVTYG